MDPASTPFPGELRERYRPVRALGAGGFGAVVLATDLRLDRPVAVKLLHGEHQDSEFAARFEREARVTAQLGHPNVVAVYDHGTTSDGTAFIVYEFVEGRDLSEVATADRPEVPVLLAWCAQVADALAAAHAVGVVHRDVKPGNILLRHEDQAVLCDFGIATLDQGRTVHTAEGIVLGTPAFLAPEVLYGARPTEASDQFALGATVLEVVLGGTAYPSGDPLALLEHLARGGRPGIPAELRGTLPALEAILERTLQAEPADRYPSIEELARALRALQRDLAEGTLPLDLPPRAPGPREARTRALPAGPRPTDRTTRKRRLPRGRGRRALGALVLAAGLAGYLLTPGSGPPPPPLAAPEDPAPTPPAPDLLAELPEARAFREAVERAERGHARPFHGNGCPERDILDYRTTIISTSTARRWRELLEAAGALARALAAPGTDPALRDRGGAEIWRKLFRAGTHLKYDLERLTQDLTEAVFTRTLGDFPDPEENPATRMHELTRETYRAYGELPGEVARAVPELFAALSSLAILHPNTEREEFYPRLVELDAGDLPPASRQAVTHARVEVASFLARRFQVECGEAATLLGDLEAELVRRFQNGEDLALPDNGWGLLSAESSLAHRCGERYPRGGPRALRPLLAASEQYNDPIGDWLETGIGRHRAAARRAGVAPRDPYHRYLREIWYLRERIRAQREEPPEVAETFRRAGPPPELPAARAALADALAPRAGEVLDLGALRRLAVATRDLVAARLLERIRTDLPPSPESEEELLDLARVLGRRIDGLAAAPATRGAVRALVEGLVRRLDTIFALPSPAHVVLLGELATRCDYPGVIWIAGQARQLALGEDQELDARLREVIGATDAHTRRAIRANHCPTLRGTMWANYHHGRTLGNETDYLLAVTGSSSLFPQYLLAGTVVGMLYARRCPEAPSGEDAALLDELVGEVTALAERGYQNMGEDVCTGLRERVAGLPPNTSPLYERLWPELEPLCPASGPARDG